MSAEVPPKGCGAACVDLWAVALATVLSGTILAVMNPAPLVRPEFWAEDGELWSAALLFGARSLLEGVGGTLHTVGRLVALLAAAAPVRYGPHVMAWTSFGILAAANGVLLHSRFESLLPGRWLRLGVCVVLSASAGTAEVSYNVANFPSLFGWLAFLGLVAFDGRLGPRSVAALSLCFASSPLSIFLVPLVLLVLVRSARQGGPQRAWAAVMVGAFVASHAANVVLTQRFTQAPYHLANHALWAPQNVWLAPTIYVDQLAMRVFVFPFFGPLSKQVTSLSGWVFWPGVVLACAGLVALVVWRRPRVERLHVLLGVAVLSAPVLLCMVAVARQYTAGYEQVLLRATNEPFLNGRYGFIGGRLAVVFWAALVSLLFGATRPRLRAPVLALLVVWFGVINLWSWERFERPDLDWPATARAIVAQSPECAIPLHPVGWKTIACPGAP